MTNRPLYLLPKSPNYERRAYWKWLNRNGNWLIVVGLGSGGIVMLAIVAGGLG